MRHLDVQIKMLDENESIIIEDKPTFEKVAPGRLRSSRNSKDNVKQTVQSARQERLSELVSRRSSKRALPPQEKPAELPESLKKIKCAAEREQYRPGYITLRKMCNDNEWGFTEEELQEIGRDISDDFYHEHGIRPARTCLANEWQRLPGSPPLAKELKDYYSPEDAPMVVDQLKNRYNMLFTRRQRVKMLQDFKEKNSWYHKGLAEKREVKKQRSALLKAKSFVFS